jgi:uncharacterized membrane protein
MVMALAWPLTRRRLLRQLDTATIDGAIKYAEAKTSGEIRVSIVGFFRGDVRALAERAFRTLGMERTRRRNGVLIVIAPTRRQVVILGDEGIATRVDPTYWSRLAEALAGHFARKDFTAGLVETIEDLGNTLGTHFPADPQEGANELPDGLHLG